MIHVIFGDKGSGKTKRILDMANEAIKSATGNIVYIDNDNKYMFDLKRDIRFIDASEYGIDSPKMFYGFICGIAAQDFDLQKIFIDGFYKIVHHELDTLEWLFNNLSEFCKKVEVEIIISISSAIENLPEYIKPYIIA